jgi:hypothetical protein
MSEPRWERQPGESTKAFAAFECYRMLGPDRSLQAAWAKHYARPGTLRERQRKGKERASQFPGYWGAWASKWQWTARAGSWDEEVAALARDQELDRALKARLAEQEEETRQRQLMREEAWAARAVARRLLRRLMQGVEAGQLDRLSVAALLPHLQRISALLETGQKLDRLFQGEPSDVTRQQTDFQEVVPKLVAVMQEFCPREQWEALAQRLDSLDENETWPARQRREGV